MSVIALNRGREALALSTKQVDELAHSEQKKVKPEGNLQGRKVIPLAFYLHVVGAVIGGLAAAALIISAIAISIFSLYFAVAACLLLCLCNILAAVFIRRLAPDSATDGMLNKLAERIEELVEINQNLKKDSKVIEIKEVKNEKAEISVEVEMADGISEDDEDEDEGNEQLNGNIEENNFQQQLNIVSKVKDNFQFFIKTHEDDKKILQKYLDEIGAFLKERGEDISVLENMKKDLEVRAWDEKITLLPEFFETINSRSRSLYNQLSELVPILKQHIETLDEEYQDFEQEREDLKAEIERITEAKNEIEKLLKQKEDELAQVGMTLMGSKIEANIQ